MAIETSCDDTSVAILCKHDGPFEKESPTPRSPSATLHFHEKITADNSQHAGIHPLMALKSHQENLASLIATAIRSLPNVSTSSTNLDPTRAIPIPAYSPQSRTTCVSKRKPDIISVTRGPGIRSSLSVGIDTAKGLAVAWQIPLVGVNHMQAHALTPRLVSALSEEPNNVHYGKPAFPFLSLLVSGGHSLLLHSKSLTEHAILATTANVAVGDVLDKIARAVCPPSIFAREPHEIMYGRLLEEFAFPHQHEYNYVAPATRGEELSRRDTRFGWSLPVPFAETRSGAKTRVMEFSFTGLGSAVERIAAQIGRTASETTSERGEEEEGRIGGDGGMEERVELAREAMRVTFEHLASRVVLALDSLQAAQAARSSANADAEGNAIDIDTLVVSGGVASNRYLRTILRAFLTARGHASIKLSFPPAELCTDNAAMIAWTGIEMYEAGWENSFREGGPGGVRALRKWSVDPNAPDGGILGVEGWVRREGMEGMEERGERKIHKSQL